MELVIFVGLQAAGKSSLYRARFVDSHTLVSKDLMRNCRNRHIRQLALVEQALRCGESVVVDNTNPQAQDRAPLIGLGKAFDATIVGYLFEGGVSDCLGRNALRQGRARVPDVAIYATAARLEHPMKAEGFDALFRVRLSGDGFHVRPHPHSKIIAPEDLYVA